MIPKISIKKHAYLLLTLVLTIWALGAVLNTFGEVKLFRLSRAVCTLVFFFYIASFHKMKTSTLLAFFLTIYLSSNLIGVWSEIPILLCLMSALLSVSVIALILYLLPKIKKVEIDRYFIVLLSIIVLVNVILLFGLIDIIYSIESNQVLRVLMYCYAVLAGVMSFIVLLFNHKRNSRASSVFTLFWLVLIFSEVFRTLAYYDIAYGQFSVYLEHFLYATSCGLLVFYSILNLKEKGVYKEKVF